MRQATARPAQPRADRRRRHRPPGARRCGRGVHPHHREALDVHPTALYRHFRDMDELLREAADGILLGLADAPEVTAEPDSLLAAAALCRGIRGVLMDHPGAAQVMSKGPSRMANERAVTERLLGLLGAAGCPTARWRGRTTR